MNCPEYEALPDSKRIAGHKDGSGLTVEDLKWLKLYRFRRASNQYRIAVLDELAIEGVLEYLLRKLPRV